ncbi:protein phosphatase inhibitor 2-like [Pteronotus mesoamericanus]|uniref:protein phosphatase inhibitor 2-like n=1 Tax=Pteronotus mesoamericanus TaxID=1884717 RepID=UPI0023EDEDE0|nr:protein phosphatase inhibitor 2-like [Pteronotus parnellii mesoamericanus]
MAASAASAASMAVSRPIKGILKNKSSAISSVVTSNEEQPGRSVEEQRKKSQRWDEMSILATYHPADKDYGLMKTDEPSTPYHRMVGGHDDAMGDSETTQALTPDRLAKKLAAAEGSDPKYRVHEQESSDEDCDFSPEEQEKKRQFEMKRKLHCNEGLNIKLGRQLSSKTLDNDEEDEEMSETTAGESMNMKKSNQGSTTGDQLQTKSQSSIEEICSTL